jgi:hypothetical protein
LNNKLQADEIVMPCNGRRSVQKLKNERAKSGEAEAEVKAEAVGKIN